jgi:hypothetical protein
MIYQMCRVSYSAPTSSSKHCAVPRTKQDDVGLCIILQALWDDVGDWLDVDLESSKALNKLLCRPLNHLWNVSDTFRVLLLHTATW